MTRFDVFYQKQIVGELSLEREGLYYHIQCRCKKRDEICRLVANLEKERIVIGVCRPEGEYLVLDRKLPAKLFGDGVFEFALLVNNDNKRFAPLDEPLPTECIKLLATAHLGICNEKIGLVYCSSGMRNSVSSSN